MNATYSMDISIYHAISGILFSVDPQNIIYKEGKLNLNTTSHNHVGGMTRWDSHLCRVDDPQKQDPDFPLSGPFVPPVRVACGAARPSHCLSAAPMAALPAWRAMRRPAVLRIQAHGEASSGHWSMAFVACIRLLKEK